MAKRRRKTIQEKTQDMIDAGSLLADDFTQLDEWDQTDPSNRPLNQGEQDQVRDAAKNQIDKFNKQHTHKP